MPDTLVRQVSCFGLPADYRARDQALSLDPADGVTAQYWTAERVADARRYQRHVYEWASREVRRRGATTLLDVGSGVGTKLVEVLASSGARLWGVDQPSAIRLAESISPGPAYWSMNFESPVRGPRQHYDAVICADVLEHLLDPDPLVMTIREWIRPAGFAVLSTPERDRLRGRDCRISPKPDHVREWSRTEFIRYVQSHGLRVLASRLVPQDDRPLRSVIWPEVLFRSRLREKSPLACHAVLCRIADNQDA